MSWLKQLLKNLRWLLSRSITSNCSYLYCGTYQKKNDNRIKMIGECQKALDNDTYLRDDAFRLYFCMNWDSFHDLLALLESNKRYYHQGRSNLRHLVYRNWYFSITWVCWEKPLIITDKYLFVVVTARGFVVVTARGKTPLLQKTTHCIFWGVMFSVDSQLRV